MIDDYENLRSAIDTHNSLLAEQHDIACSQMHAHDPDTCGPDDEILRDLANSDLGTILPAL